MRELGTGAIWTGAFSEWRSMREVRTMLDKSADRQAAILRAVTATLITTLVGALGFILWQVYTHPHGFGP